MKILFIGGNGNISWWCAKKALELGHEVWELNRSISRETRRSVPKEIHEIVCDIRDVETTALKLKGFYFDVICDFICFNHTHAKNAYRLFAGITNQYIVISSEAVYSRNSKIPFTEDSVKYKRNEVDGYIKGKLEIEDFFEHKYLDDKFPVTIVRPGFTYDTIVYTPVGRNCFTVADMLKKGLPAILIENDNHKFTPTHSEDFAECFCLLMGNEKAIGECYQISGDIIETPKTMVDSLFKALDVRDKKYIYISKSEAVKYGLFRDMSLLENESRDCLLDCSKIKKLVPQWKQRITYEEGIQRTIEWIYTESNHIRINQEFRNLIMEVIDNKF